MTTSSTIPIFSSFPPESSSTVANNGGTKLFPSPRMNAGMVVKNNILYLYGGLVEEGDRQYTLCDFYSLGMLLMICIIYVFVLYLSYTHAHTHRMSYQKVVIFENIYVHMFVCMFVCMCICIYLYVYLCMCVCVCVKLIYVCVI